jgi:hypothetical protein
MLPSQNVWPLHPVAPLVPVPAPRRAETMRLVARFILVSSAALFASIASAQPSDETREPGAFALAHPQQGQGGPMKRFALLPLLLLPATGCGKLYDRLDCINYQLCQTNQQLADANVKLDAANEKLASQDKKLAEANKTLVKQEAQLGTANKNLETVAAKIDDGTKELVKISDATDKTAKSTAATDKGVEGASDKLEKLDKDLSDLGKQLQQNLGEILKKLPGPKQ